MLRKKQYLLQDGDVCRYLAFVEKSLLRSYNVDDRGSEHMLQFAWEDWWISDTFSFLSEEPAAYNIDANDHRRHSANGAGFQTGGSQRRSRRLRWR